MTIHNQVKSVHSTGLVIRHKSKPLNLLSEGISLKGTMNYAHHKPTSNRGYFEAESIGNLAFDSLSTDQKGSVLGLTSRGVFIKTENKWMNFLSFESFRGPLTINLPMSDDSILPISRGMSLRITARQILFPDADLVISVQNPVVWQPEPPSAPPLPKSERQQRLFFSAKQFLTGKKGTGLGELLPELLNFSSQPHPYTQEISPIDAKILNLQREMISSSRLPTSESLISLLGSGSGLTPSGDDLVCGILLALNRWENVIVDGQDLDRLNEQVVKAAYRKTTTLSANLIECATLGLADERLIEALDWLVSGRDQKATHIDELLNWGNSSGMDVFVGYVVALSV
jgi:hypothetical protein